MKAEIKTKQEPMADDEYVKECQKTGPNICPLCRGQNINVDRPSSESGDVSSECFCKDCNFKWSVHYSLTVCCCFYYDDED